MYNINCFEGPMLLSNNSRRLHGLKPHRKSDKRKRFFTRCEVSETVEAFLNFCDYSNFDCACIIRKYEV